MHNKKSQGNIYKNYDPNKDYVNENTYMYTGIKSDVPGIILLVLSVLAVFLSVVSAAAALPVSLILLGLSLWQYFKNKSFCNKSAIVCSCTALLVCVFILLVNYLVY